MSGFTDALMLRLHAASALPGLLFPSDPQGADRIRQLAGTLYGLPAAGVHDIGEYATLAEFEAKFRYFDLAGYLARHHITTVEELKGAYRHLLGEIRLAAPPPFDPADPAHQRRVPLELAVLVRSTVDLTEALRSARLVRDLAERGTAYGRAAGAWEVHAPLAPVLVFPAAAVAASGVPEAVLVSFFAAQDVLAISLPP